MSAAAVLVGSKGGGASFSVNGSNYTTLGGFHDTGVTTEANVQTVAQTSWTAQHLGCNVSGNANSGTAQLFLRVAGADGNNTISFGSSTGWLSDSSHSDSIVAGNKLCIRYGANNTGAVNIRTMALELDGSAGLYTASYPLGAGQTGFMSSMGIVTSAYAGFIETWANFYVGVAGTSSQMCVNKTTGGNSWTVQSRVNTGGGAANGNQVVSVGTSVAIYQDTSHSDSWLAGYTVDSNQGSTNFNNMTLISYQFAPTSGGSIDWGNTMPSGGTNNVANSTTGYGAIGGGNWANTDGTETNHRVELGQTCTLSNLRVLLPVTTNCSVTTHARINGGSGNQTTSTASGATTPGWVVDGSHSDSVVATDVLNIQLVTGAGSATSISQFGMSGAFSISASVNLTGAAASGAAAGVAASSSGSLGAASASGAAAGVTPSISVTPGAAAASGAAAGVHAQQGLTPSTAAASGAAAPVTPQVSVTLSGVHASGAVAGMQISSGASPTGVGATAGVAAVIPSIAHKLAPAIAFPAAAPITFGQQIPFPLFSIMRDAAVAMFGSMSDTPVALVGRIPPSGPEPFSVEVFLVGVSATAHAATITPSRDVSVPLAPAIAVGNAAPVVAA